MSKNQFFRLRDIAIEHHPHASEFAKRPPFAIPTIEAWNDLLHGVALIGGLPMTAPAIEIAADRLLYELMTSIDFNSDYKIAKSYTQDERQSAADRIAEAVKDLAELRGRDIPFDSSRFLDDTPATDAPFGAKAEAVRGIDKQRVITAFHGMHFKTDTRWSKALAAPDPWLMGCRVAQGSKKASALWNPVLIAVALSAKGISLTKLDGVFVGLKDWQAEWQEKSAILRD